MKAERLLQKEGVSNPFSLVKKKNKVRLHENRGRKEPSGRRKKGEKGLPPTAKPPGGRYRKKKSNTAQGQGLCGKKRGGPSMPEPQGVILQKRRTSPASPERDHRPRPCEGGEKKGGTGPSRAK